MTKPWMVFRRGGSIGDISQAKKSTHWHPKHGLLVSDHDTEGDAKAHASRLNKTRSLGDRGYYKVWYHVKSQGGPKSNFEAGAADLAALQFASKAKTGDYVRMLNSKTGEKVHGVFVNKRGYGIGVFHPSRMKNTIPGSEVTLPENLGEDPGYSWHDVRHELNKKSTDTQRKARITKLKKAGALSPESPENFEACSLDLATLQFASGENPRKPKNLMYGYFGTARLHLGNDVAAHVDFAKARLALQHHYGMSPRRARTLLDTRYGRHLADRVHGDKLSHAEAVHHLGHPKHWDSRFAEGTF